VSVEPENTQTLVKGIKMLLNMNAEELKVYSENARKVVLQGFTTRVVAKKFENYSSVSLSAILRVLPF